MPLVTKIREATVSDPRSYSINYHVVTITLGGANCSYTPTFVDFSAEVLDRHTQIVRRRATRVAGGRVAKQQSKKSSENAERRSMKCPRVCPNQIQREDNIDKVFSIECFFRFVAAFSACSLEIVDSASQR